MANTTLSVSPVNTSCESQVATVSFNEQTKQNSLHAAASFLPGEIICAFGAATVQKEASYLTIQTGTESHITLKPDFLQFTNHSCDPNAFFDTAKMELICLREINPGDEISFFYPSTEWEMAQPFVCNCGSEACIQLINGASHLSVNTLSKYKLTDFIKQQLKNKLSL